MSDPELDMKMQKIAQKVISNIHYSDPAQKDNFGFIITTLMIISIVLTLIRVIQECNKNKINSFNSSEKYDYFGNEIKTLSVKKSWFTKMIVKKTLRKVLDKEQYKAHGLELMNAILDTGENLTNDEIATLVEVSNV